MATELTLAARLRAASRTQEPQLVLKIDGVSTIYGVGEIKKYIKIGDPNLFIGNDWKIGGLNKVEDQLVDSIDLTGSTNTLAQQLLQDKGGTSSIPSIQVSLIDTNGEITKLITPGEVLEDLLGTKAEVYLGYQETAFPQDFVRIFSGIIDEISGGTTIILNVAHPEQKKRAEIFQQVTTELTTDLNYRSANLQHIKYQTRRDVVGSVTVTYTTGATFGSEVVTVIGNNITVQIAAGVTRAREIRDKIERSVDALALVEIKIDSGFQNEIQTAMGLTTLGSDSVINVTSTKGFLLPVPSQGFRTYVRVDDEVIEYTGMTDTTLTGITRGALVDTDQRAEAAPHEIETSVDTFYRLQGDAFELALKVMLSGGPKYFVENVPVKSIVDVEGVGSIPNAIWFDGVNVQDAYGVTVNDLITVEGDQNPLNNFTDKPVADVIATPYGSYVIVDGVTLYSQPLSSATVKLSSKWNVYPEGAGLQMGGDEVDVPEFERLRDIFSSSIFTYDFYLKETIVGKDFVDTELLFPTGAYTLPRRGKVSAGYTSPPLGSGDIKKLDSNNTTKPEQNRIKRSLNKYFYNNVVFRYNEAVVDDRFLSGDVEVSQDSKNRIKVGNKTLVINARGLRPSTDATVIIEILKKRFQDKYKFGAEVISTFAFYGETFNTDIGDVVIYGDANLKIPDTKKGSRKFSPRLFEVQNKSLGIKTGEVKLDLLDSGYSLADGRYGIISPASQTLALGSTINQIKIKNSYETVTPQREKTKWNPYIGQRILVHDDDWNYVAETTLVAFSPSDDYVMLVDPALPFIPQDNYVVEVCHYPDNDNPEDQELSKRVFVYTNPTVEVISGSSDTEFTVSVLDADKFLEGAILLVRDENWDIVSPEVHVESIVGNVITVDTPLGFTPAAGYEIDLIGFKDGGAPYRYL